MGGTSTPGRGIGPERIQAQARFEGDVGHTTADEIGSSPDPIRRPWTKSLKVCVNSLRFFTARRRLDAIESPGRILRWDAGDGPYRARSWWKCPFRALNILTAPGMRG